MMILVDNNNIKLTINEEVLDNTKCIGTQIIEDYLYNTDDVKSVEDLEELLLDEIRNYITDDLTPIYYNFIRDRFNSMEVGRIEELINDYGIEYTGDFHNFMQAVLYYEIFEEVTQDIYQIIQNIEEEKYTEEDYKEVKNDIINYLDNYCDTLIEEQSELYRKYGGLGAIGIINRHISEINYCSYAVVGDGENLRGWKVFTFFIDKLYHDKDIQEAVRNYMNY